ncbi:MAG TPA: zinc-dependent metalloprotease [Vicinamibacterales bacterium]|jgi:hypothetical protein
MGNWRTLPLTAILMCVLTVATQAALQSGTPATKQTQSTDTKKPEAGDTADKKPEPPPDKPFADLIKDAKTLEGLFNLYQTEEKVFLEIQPDQFEKMFIVSLTCESGIGERGFYAAQMCGHLPVVFRKQAKNVQLIARNTRFVASETTALHRALDRSFSDSILGSTKIESLPHPDRKSVLIDLGGLLLTDLPMQAYALETTFRIPYRFDAKNSSFATIKAFPRNIEISTIGHYSTERPPVPPLVAPGTPVPPTPPPPRNLPDVRSMLFNFRYSISDIPSTAGFQPRLVDDRVGHFFEDIDDFTTDAPYTPRRRYITRWALEKEDPSAVLSRPKKPIVFWMENTIPVKYRDAVHQGALLWNKAFEKIGFKDAIVVNQQPDDADWDPADIRYNTIRWFAATDASFAIGPSRANPLTGELYDADISFADGLLRTIRREVPELINPLSWEEQTPLPPVRPLWMRQQAWSCTAMSETARDAAFGFDLLLARGMEPDSPEADAFVNQWLIWLAAHEVGHTLGLRHNFRASTIHAFNRLHDTSLTSSQGLTGSVMDYVPTNLARKGQPQGDFQQTSLGPYDYWAIEYAYKPVTGSPEGERAELNKIASRVADPMLAYATDEDAGFGPLWPWSSDPLATRNDLGSDPLEYYKHSVALSQELWTNMEATLQKPGEGYQILRRSFLGGLGKAGGALLDTTRYIGGVYHYRDHVGDPGNRLPFTPVPVAKQKEALNLIRENLFSPGAFRFSPQLLNKLAVERFPDFSNFASLEQRSDYPIHQQILSLQTAALNRLFHPVIMSRVLDNELRVEKRELTLTLGTVFSSIQDAIWAELQGPAVSINSFRRSLQREHLRKMIALVLREAAVPEDARSLARHSLTTLRARARTATTTADSVETRAHLNESVARIDEALRAQLQRSAF